MSQTIAAPGRRRALLAGWLLALAMASLAVGRAAAQAVTRAAIITTVAGNGTIGTIGNGGPATAAELVNPTGIAVDASGNIYIAEPQLRKIQKVSPAGVITVYAGTGAPGTSGDGGPATSARFKSVALLTVDPAGNLYIPDQTGYKVRKITANTGIITTVAGTGSGGFAGDGGAATAAQLGGPSSVAFDGTGNMYIADTYGNRIRMVAAGTGIISTVAGNGTSGYVADGVQATTTELNFPTGVAVDGAGNVYIGDTSNQRIRKVTAATGLISTIAGDGTAGYSGDNGQALSAELNFPSGIALDPQGNLAVADRLNHATRMVDLSTGIITTVAGTGTAAYSGDNGLAATADLNYPFSIAFDPGGNLFIADYFNNVIRRVNSTLNVFFPATAVGSTSASVTMPLLINSDLLEITGLSVPVSQGGVQEYVVTGDSCALNTPLAAGTICAVTLTFSPGYPGVRGLPLAVATSGGAFRFGMTGMGLGPQAQLTPALIATVIGTGAHGFSGDGGPATSATLASAYGFAVDPEGNLYLSDRNNYVIRRVDAITNIISTIAGTPGQSGSSGAGGAATSAHLYRTNGLAVDSAGNLYIAEFGNSDVRRVDASTGIITTVAGTPGVFGYSGDGGLATAAQLNRACDVALDRAGNLYIADEQNNVIRRVDASTGVITTVVGNGSQGYSGDNGPALDATLFLPVGLKVDALGDLYISDSDNEVIRKVTASTGIITTVAGDHSQAFGGNGGPATAASLSDIVGLALDAAGDFYIADSGNNEVRAVNASSGIIHSVAGTSVEGYSGDGGPATAALMGFPEYPGVDNLGNLYFGDGNNDVFREVGGVAPLDFGPVDVGASATAQDITVTNAGSAALVISALTLPADYNLSGADTTCASGSSLAPSTSCILGVVFAPASVGVKSETLTVVDNQGTQSVPLGGTGVAAPQTITFANPGGQSFGGLWTLTATASSGLAVSYTSSTPAVCTVSASAVTFVAAGSCTINAAQAGNANYAPAVGVAETFTVVPGSPTITFSVAGQTFGAVPFTVVATSNSSGAITYSVVSGPATVSGATVSITGAGAVVLLATQAAAGNYAATTQMATFVVAVGSPTISFAVAGKTFGAAPFVVAATSNSSGAITYSVISGPATVSGATVTITGAGAVVLMASQAAAGNYAATTQTATFVVAVGSPTISFAVPGQTFGAAPFVVAATSNSSGAITYSVVSGPATVSGSTVSLTGPGAVVLLASQAAAANYAATTQTATFGVAVGSSTISFVVPGQTFGAAPFVVVATSNSSGAITYSVVSGPATVSGSTVSLTGAGAVVLLASQAAAGNYAATTQTATFVVAGGSPTISFTVPAQTFGAAPFVVAATSNSTGLITYSVVSGPATISGATVSLTGPGTVTLLASQAAAGNYAAGTQTATFVAGSGTPTVTGAISPATPVYGQAVTITVTETAGGSPVGGATATVMAGGQIYTCATTSSGRCAVTVPGGVLSGGSAMVTGTTGAVGSVTAGAFSFAVTVAPAPTTLTLGSSSSEVTVGNPVTLTATAASATAGTPTGTVIFYGDGTSIGTGTVAGGVASLTLTTLSVGADAISAVYGGDANFIGSTATGFTQTVLVNFTITAGSGSTPPTQTTQPGGTAVFPLSLGIIDGFVGQVTMSATGLPPGATATFNPAVISLDGVHPATTTLSVATAATRAQAVPAVSPRPGVGSGIGYGLLLLPLLGIAGIRKRLLTALALLSLEMGLIGCGSGGYFGAAPSSYVITVTATSGALHHSTTVTLTVE